jgi:hypothetical protein
MAVRLDLPEQHRQDRFRFQVEGLILVKHGIFTFGGFTLNLFNGAAALSIPTPTLANPNATSVSVHFPSMGWGTRWRYNPTPRAEVRTRIDLLNLNLVPNFSAAMGAQFSLPNTGGGPDVGYIVTRYSSAYAPATGNNANPVGVNENCGIATNTGGVGGRPELGLCTDWQANWIANGNTAAHDAMMVLAEVAGGMPWIIRDQGVNAPFDFTGGTYTTWTFGAGGNTHVDIPTVPVPGGGGSGNWFLELNHLPSLSYVPYMLTGDTYHLENMQFAASYIIGNNGAHRGGSSGNGFNVNYADIAGTQFADAGSIALMPSYFSQSRGLGWAIRSWAQAYLSTPASTPSWLLSKAQCKTVLDQNQAYADQWGTNHDANYPGHTYPNLTAIGAMPGAVDADASFFQAYLMMGLGFAITQAGLTNWLPFWNFAAKRALNWTNGTSGWDNRLPAPYNNTLLAVSTDYTGAPSTIANFSDMWSFFIANCGFGILNGWSAGGSTSGLQSVFPSYLPSHSYVCNSWIVEFRGGVPVQPVAGEVVSLTISGSFVGSPVTVSHTISSGDVATMAAWTVVSAAPGAHPIVDDLITKINASAAGTAGIQADTANHATTGYWQSGQTRGRMYLSFNSAVVGDIVVTKSYTTATVCSVYIQPNGDGIHTAASNPGSGMYGRTISYQASKTGLSGGGSGPTGTTPQTIVADGGTMSWCFAPELKSNPVCCPSIGTQAAFPRMMTVGTLSNPVYCALIWNACNLLLTGGIVGSEVSQPLIKALVQNYLTTIGSISGINWAVASIEEVPGGFTP